MPALTRLLDQRNSPLRAWFEDTLPHLDLVQAAWKRAGPPTLLPRAAKPAWGLHGAAVDYRIRYLFTVTPASDLVAADGALLLDDPVTRLLRASGEAPPSSWNNLAADLDAQVADHPPTGNLCTRQAERRLARFCYLLAAYEAYARAGRAWRPLEALGGEASTDEQLALVDDDAVDDIVAVSGAFVDVAGHLLHGLPAVMNPVLGRPPIAADADLLVDGLLLEIKTSKQPRPDREWVYQLVGYLLLDIDNRYRIERLGFYLSRVPALLDWNASELLEALAGRHLDVDELRSGFLAAGGCVR